MRTRTLTIAFCLIVMPALASSACPDDAAIDALAEDILTAAPTEAPTVESRNDGLCAQGKLVQRL
ncbi:hypothetical protein [Arhodomonas sp. SL1]|uniref:hypothetical protein n=1 Tax=Arhodomonas sp. SL1 TaxID=3425691 RepID=UPI003F883B25